MCTCWGDDGRRLPARGRRPNAPRPRPRCRPRGTSPSSSVTCWATRWYQQQRTPAAIVSRAEHAMARVEFAKAPRPWPACRPWPASWRHRWSARGQALRGGAQPDAGPCPAGCHRLRARHDDPAPGPAGQTATMLARVVADPSAEAESRANCASNLSTVRLNLDDIPWCPHVYRRGLEPTGGQCRCRCISSKATCWCSGQHPDVHAPVAEADALFARAAALMRAPRA